MSDQPEEQLVNNAAKLSLKNRTALEAAAHCGCYQCIRTFETSEITQWTDKDQTALCPHCGIDSIVAGITDIDVLTKMCLKWFTGTSRSLLLPQ